MFISPEEAKERLQDDRNLFRKGGDDASVGQSGNKSEGAESHRVSVPSTSDPDDEPILSSGTLTALDSLISSAMNPRPPRANFRGKEQAQIAIAETSMILGQHATARALGLSQEQTLAYERGLQGTHQITEGVPPDPIRKAKLDAVRMRLGQKAANRLNRALNALTTDKLDLVQSATDVARIAKDMAVVMDKVLPKESGPEGGIHFHVWRPEIKTSKEYKTIEVGAALDVTPSLP